MKKRIVILSLFVALLIFLAYQHRYYPLDFRPTYNVYTKIPYNGEHWTYEGFDGNTNLPVHVHTPQLNPER